MTTTTNGSETQSVAINLTINYTRNDSGRLVNLSVSGLPESVTDWDFECMIREDIVNNGPWAGLEWILKELGNLCSFGTCSHKGWRLYVDES